MVTWPMTLPPAPLLEGFVERTSETVIRTDMDQGPAKTRRRTTAGTREFQMTFIMTKNEIATFDDFFLNDINGGASSFDFIHPRTGETLNLRLKNPPEYQAQNTNYFRISLEAEALP